MKNKVTVTGANLVFFIFTAIFILLQLALIVILGVLNYIYGSDFANKFINQDIYVTTAIVEYLFILTPVLVYSAVKKINFKEVFRLNNPGLKPLLLITVMSIPAYFVALMLNGIVIYLLQFVGSIPPSPIPTPRNLPELFSGLFFIALTPGICEEMLHRGLLLTAYENRGTKKAIVISSIFFGIFHYDITNLLGPIFLGLLIGYYVIRTDSIFSGILAHFLNNAIAEVLQYLSTHEVSPQAIEISFQEILLIVLYGILGCIALTILVLLFKKNTEGQYQYKPAISDIKGDIISIVSHWPVFVVILIYIFMAVFYLMILSNFNYLM